MVLVLEMVIFFRLWRADFRTRELGGEMIIYSQKIGRSQNLFFFYMSHVDFHVDSHVDFHVDSEIRKKVCFRAGLTRAGFNQRGGFNQRIWVDYIYSELFGCFPQDT